MNLLITISLFYFRRVSIVLSLIAVFTINTAAQDVAAKPYMPDGYSIETITTPADIPFHVTGMDINKQGDLVVATRLGDVWVLSDRQWRKFADGLTEPTGLLCEDDGSVVVGQKPELTRLLDSNNDNIADEYINLADGWGFHDNYHEFNFAPVKDKHGNYYGALNLGHGNRNAFSLGVMDSAGGYRGWAYKVSSEGEFIAYASGLRSPAGIGLSPAGEIFYTDNQGDWVPTSKLHLLQQGKFYGHPVSLRDAPGYTPETISKMSLAELETLSEIPVLWIPHEEVGNSPGNPEWDMTGGQFGPFSGQMFIGDQTQSNIYRVLLENVNGQYQGAVINFMSGFQSGNIRIAFDKQGRLWVGQTARGWHAKGSKPYGLQRVDWDGKTNPFELLNIKITKTGFRMDFTEPLKKDSVQLNSFNVEQWHYYYSGNYGSEKMALSPIAVASVTLSDNKQSVDIALPLTKGKVVALDFAGLVGESGRSPSVDKVYYTVNALK